uniref:Uncharacterized protein n=1 Tax=Balaenoptera musculus TaxID=9771 RepID=A0A8C0CA20_BALMU
KNLTRTLVQKTKAILCQRCMKRPSTSPPGAVGTRRKGKPRAHGALGENCLPIHQAAASAWRPSTAPAKKAWISSRLHRSPGSPSSPMTFSTTPGTLVNFAPWVPHWPPPSLGPAPRLPRRSDEVMLEVLEGPA